LPADLDREGVEVIGKIDAAIVPVRNRILFPSQTIIQRQLAADLPLVARVKRILPLPHFQIRLIHLDPLVSAIESAQEEVGERIILIRPWSAIQNRRRSVEDVPVLPNF